MIKWLSTCLLLINFQAICYSATYYLSNNGDDLNSGQRIENSWKSIERLNEFLLSEEFHPGDRILFRRGDFFYGQINLPKGGNKQNPVEFGAYGLGEKPIISGAIPITDWDRSDDGILSTQVKKDSIFQLFQTIHHSLWPAAPIMRFSPLTRESLHENFEEMNLIRKLIN